MDLELFKLLFDYNFWAHQRVWTGVVRLTNEEFQRDLGSSLGSIHSQLVHTMSTEWMWLSLLRGENSLQMFKTSDFRTRAAIRGCWDAVEEYSYDYLKQLTAEAMHQPVERVTAGGAVYTETVAQILLHIVHHSTDHRGQTLAMLQTLGVPIIEQDMIFFLRSRG